MTGPLRLRQFALEPDAVPTGDVGLAGGNEAGLGENSLGSNILVRGPRMQPSNAVLRSGQPAQLPQTCGRHSPPRGSLGHAIADLGGVVLDVVQIEPADYRPIIVHEHVVGVTTGFPLGEELVVPFAELVEECIASVGDERTEVRSVGQFERQHFRGVAGTQSLEVEHVSKRSDASELRLYTKRLCLRVPISQDAKGLYDLFADAEVMRGLGKEPVSTVEQVRAMIEEGMLGGWRTDGLGAFVLETTADRQVIGQAGLMIFDSRDWTPSTWAQAGSRAQPELGWALTCAHWGHGYATEAAAAIRDWALEQPKIDRLVSLISAGNVRSQRVAERLGALPGETVTPAHSKRTTVVWTHRPNA